MTDELRELIERLEPCPFCGSEATFEQPYEGSWVFCSNIKCNAYQARHTAEGAISAWNTRDQSLSERNAELEGEIRHTEIDLGNIRVAMLSHDAIWRALGKIENRLSTSLTKGGK